VRRYKYYQSKFDIMNTIITRTITMSRSPAAFAFILASTGCFEAIRDPQLITNEFAETFEKQRSQAMELLVWPECEIPKKEGLCGLISEDELQSVGTFIRDTYHESVETNVSDACRSKFVDHLQSKFRSRYSKAKMSEVNDFCKSQPEHCSTFKLLELQWLTSHNAAIFSDLHALSERILAQHSAAQAANSRAIEDRRALGSAIGEGLKSFGSTLQNSVQSRPSVHCSSNRVGDSVFTDCH